MKNRPSDLPETLSKIAADKIRAGLTRFQPRDPEAEGPRKVYLAASQSIGSAFTPLGFRYLKSAPGIVRRRGDWKETGSFQSSTHNVAGARVALSAHAVVWNAKLKKWRESQRTPFAAWDRVAGGQLGNLRLPTGWLDWDLADAAARPGAVADVVAAIRELALPYFDLFQDVRGLYETLLSVDVPALDPKDAAETLICYLGRQPADAYLNAWLGRHPSLSAGVREAQSAIRAGANLRNRYTEYAVQAAYLVVHYGLKLDV